MWLSLGGGLTDILIKSEEVAFRDAETSTNSTMVFLIFFLIMNHHVNLYLSSLLKTDEVKSGWKEAYEACRYRYYPTLPCLSYSLEVSCYTC